MKKVATVILLIIIALELGYVSYKMFYRQEKVPVRIIPAVYVPPENIKKETEPQVSKYHMQDTGKKIDLSPRDIQCLDSNIYHEAGVESKAGKLAVAQVTYNRMRTGDWGKTICAVVHAPKQFSWVGGEIKKKSGKLWDEAVKIRKEFMEGLRIPALNNALYFHTKAVRPKWSYKLDKIMVIGNHIFYE